MQPWHPAAQSRRRNEIMALIRERYRELLDDRGENDCLVRHEHSREGSRASIAFLCSDAPEDIAYGNLLLRRVRDTMPLDDMPHPFEVSTYAGLLARHEDKLEADVRDYVRGAFEDMLPKGMTRDYQFHGYNDNMPVMWTWALLFGGEYFERPDFLDIARANMQQLRDQLRRRGTVSEFGAGYCCHRQTGFAHIVAHSRSAELRELAADIEARIWAELAGHWNPRLAQVCGASMRGDMRQGALFSRENYALFRYVFGDGILLDGIDWRDYFDGEPETIRELGLDPSRYAFSSGLALGAEFCDAVFHVPEQVARLFYAKPVPFTFRCSTETNYYSKGHYTKTKPVYGKSGTVLQYAFTDEIVHIPHYPAAPAQRQDLTTWHGRAVSLGISTLNQFGSSNPFRCHYLRDAMPASRAAFGSVHARYNINDKQAGAGLRNEYWKTPEMREEQANRVSMYDDMGRFRALQHGATALCHYAPQALAYWQVRSLKCDLLFDERDAPVRVVRFNGAAVDTFPFEAPEPGVITIDEGAAWMAVHPLIGRARDRRAAVRIRRTGEFLVVSFYNYEGPAVELSHYEIAQFGNGFVFEARDAADGAFETFERDMLNARVLDQLYSGTRRLHYFRDGLRLSLGVCPHTDSVMFESVNGREPERPRLAFSDGSEAGLPFLDDPPAVGFEDYDWLKTQIDRTPEAYNPVD